MFRVVGRLLTLLRDLIEGLVWISAVALVVYLALVFASSQAPGLVPVLHIVNTRGLALFRFARAVAGRL